MPPVYFLQLLTYLLTYSSIFKFDYYYGFLLFATIIIIILYSLVASVSQGVLVFRELNFIFPYHQELNESISIKLFSSG